MEGIIILAQSIIGTIFKVGLGAVALIFVIFLIAGLLKVASWK